MKRAGLVCMVACVGLASTVPAFAQIGGVIGRATKTAMTLKDMNITEQDEHAIGALVSQRVREQYGVVQDGSVHRYVALVGTTLARQSARPKLAWSFIVLDTDGVNAFAAPGGFVHITRGALALLRSEAELAGVLGHEIVHITEKHTLEAIRKGKATDLGIDMGSDMAPGGGLGKSAISKLADKATDMVMAGFGRSEELESDHLGVHLASKAGYAPQGLGAFLTTLAERNKAATEKQGLFASHPQMKERLDKIESTVSALTPAGAATLEDRYRAHIAYQPRSQAEIAEVTEGAAGLTGGGKAAASQEPRKDEQQAEEKKKKRGFGLGNLVKPGGDEKKSAQVTGSGAGRGVDTERNARGGSNPALVAVSLSPQDLETFKKEGQLN
jgi:beta-barrel assembly-enhancing protease